MIDEDINAYILAHHSTMKRTTIARRCGIGMSSLYRRFAKLGVQIDNNFEEKKRKKAENEAIVKREYTLKSQHEIAREYGISKTTVGRIVKRLNLQHSSEGQQRIDKAQERGRICGINNNKTAAARKKASEKRIKIFKREYWRVSFGGKQKTKLKLKTMTKKAWMAKWALCNRYGYIETTEPYLLWYDDATQRDRLRWGETFYTKKYGLTFAAAED